jgi:hypothetical protein
MPKVVHDVGGTVLDCGLDYLRVTCLDFEKPVPNVLHAVKVMQDTKEDAGFKRVRTAAEGFEGESCGGWRYGHRDGRTLLEASSEDSAKLLELIKSFYLDCRATRADLHVTYARARYNDEWAIEMRGLVREAERLRDIKRQIECDIKDRPATGNTLYCYSRSNRRYLRDYDKSAEQRHIIPAGTFRAEVEFKREMARELFGRIRNCGDVRMLALDVLTHEWKRLGINRNWNWQGEPVDLRLEKRPPDQVRTAQWFMNTAVPAFHRLTDPALIAECLERLLTDPATGAYKEFEAPPTVAPTAPRRPRQEVAAEARRKVRESLNIAPLGAWKQDHVCQADCRCPEAEARREAAKQRR